MSQVFEDQGLMLGNKINWSYILGLGVLKVDEALVKEEGFQSEQQVREAVLILKSKIPDAWVLRDTKWKKEVANAVVETEEDIRPTFCGIRIGIPKFKKVSVVHPIRLYHAVVNVFHRRGLLSKTIFQEVMIPNPEQYEKNGEELKNAITTNEEEIARLEEEIAELEEGTT